MSRLSKYFRKFGLAFLLHVPLLAQNSIAQSPSNQKCQTISAETSRIVAPGKYCLDGDRIARMNLPDRRSETWLLWIRSSDVDLDLNGKTIGRRTGIFGSAGGGILIDEKVVNLTIRNGRIRYLDTCVLRVEETGGGRRELIEPVSNGAGNFDFPEFRISFRGVEIDHCKPFLFEVRRR